MFSIMHFRLLISSFLLLLATFAIGEKVVIDLQPESANKLIEVTCLYNEDYNDFWVYGYPVTFTSYEDIYPEKAKGFWTPGHAQRCELHYFGGGHMPMAKSVTIGLYLKGKPQILISSKYSPVDEEYDNEIGTVSESDGQGWFETTIDLTEHRALVFNFTLISMPDDLLILDKLVFDLGDDTTTPTEPPPPTTSRPIDESDTVLLDTDDDYWLFWEYDCNYVKDYADNWVYGCPTEPKEENLEVGYWNPCSSTKSCTLRFKGGSTLLPNTPTNISIDSYIDGDAKINITIQRDHDEICKRDCREVEVLTKSDKWTRTMISQGMLADIYTINIQLIPSENSVVLIDKISLAQGSPGEITSTPDPTTDPTEEDSSEDPTTTEDSGENPGPGSGAGTASLGWLIIPIFLIQSVHALKQFS